MISSAVWPRAERQRSRRRRPGLTEGITFEIARRWQPGGVLEAVS